MLINLRNALMAGKRLPYDAELECLESTGTQYIDTGIIGGSSSKVEITASSSNTALNMGLFGSRNAQSVKAFTIWQRVSNTSVRFDFTDDTANRVIANAAWDTSGFNTVIKDGPNNTLNGVAGANNATATFTCEYPFYLFSINTAGTATSNASARIYSCKIWQSGVLVRDYIPVRVGSGASAVGYLYDRVSRRLFGNAGTGDFVLGPDKAVPVLSLHRYASPSNGVALGKTGCTDLFHRITARDYVQDGLEIHLDGIENYAYGEHSTTLTYWRDLISGYETAASMIPSGDDAMKFALSNQSLYFFEANDLPLATRQKFANGYTVEMLARASAVNVGSGILARLYDGAHYFVTFTSGASAVIATSAGVSTGNLQLHESGIVAFSATYDPAQGVATIARDGIQIASGSPSYSVGTLTTIGKRATNSVQDYCELRLYSRALTAAEIARNYTIDKARFGLPDAS